MYFIFKNWPYMETVELSINKEQTDACVESLIRLVKNLKEVNHKVLSMASCFETVLSVSHSKNEIGIELLNQECQELQELNDGLDK